MKAVKAVSAAFALMAFAFCPTPASAGIFDVKLTLWRGETAAAFVPGACELGACPDGLKIRRGVLAKVSYSPGNEGDMRRQEVYDRVLWDVVDEDAPQVVEVTAPVDAKPGVYTCGGMTVTVIDRVLPPPKEWKYYLDLWQHPWAVARFEKVKPFSKEHYAAMRSQWELLATAGQKTITTTICDLPWNHQCRDAYHSMITDDFGLFDEYVEFCLSCGLGPDIACYSLCPWSFGEVTEEKLEKTWGAFLDRFAAHLKAKGWYERTYMAMDERSPGDVKKIVDFVHRHAPGLRVSMAGNCSPSSFKGIEIDSYSQICSAKCITTNFLAEAADRRARGLVTTYYVCCAPGRPNTFMNSDANEAFWCGAAPAFLGLDGLLRWAWNSWPQNPEKDASSGLWWRSGDTFLSYPKGRPSWRFLELRNGIVASEKARILREQGLFVKELDALAKAYDVKAATGGSANFRDIRKKTLELVNRFDAVPAALTADVRTLVPEPVYDEAPEFVDLYYKAWELAKGRIHRTPGLPAEYYMDEGLVETDIWIWDTAFMALYCKYAPAAFPGIESLDNFYAILSENAGAKMPMVKNDCPWLKAPRGSLVKMCLQIADNPPIMAWAECEYAKFTGDRKRLEGLLYGTARLTRYYDFVESFKPGWIAPGVRYPIVARKTAEGYHWRGGQSGMDNTPRGRADGAPAGTRPNQGDLLWVDLLAQQALAAESISRLYRILGDLPKAELWQEKAAAQRKLLNGRYWSEKDGFYFDVVESSKELCRVTTPASFWAMLAGAPDASAARRMCEKLQEGGSLCVPGGVPSLARTDVDFNPQGRYWLGSVWLPTSYMTVKAVERYGRLDLAREIALKTVRHQYETFRSVSPHTIWECYNPLEPMPATRANGSPRVAPDFCGWSALGPISLLLENVIGIRSADAFENRVVWDPPAHPGKRLGVRRYRFGSTVCDLLLANGRVTVTANRAFTLVLDGVSHAVDAGTTTFARGE